jgi:hypothetical protein
MDEAAVGRALAGIGAAAGRKRFGPEAMARVVIALRAGATVRAAAEAAGFHRTIVNRWRAKSPAFDAACAAAVTAGDVPRLVYRQGGDGSGWQVRRGRRHSFSTARKQAFLEHFAATLDAVAAAEVAGVCFSTAYHHRRTDPAFAAQWAEAARIGVSRLSEEAGRQRLAAMEQLRVAGDKIVPEAAAEFERTMTFLKVWGSRVAGETAGGGGGRGTGGPALTKWSFEEALVELEAKLKAFGVRIGPVAEAAAGDAAEAAAEVAQDGGEEGEDGDRAAA